MPMPNLIHPVPIEIEKIDSGETIMDEDYREPVQQSRRAAKITVNGQVKWGMEKGLSAASGGPEEHYDGYVLFRYTDLTAASVLIERNDRFTSIDGIETDVYVIRLKPMGHYPGLGATLVRAYFLDRQPTRQGLAT